MPAWSSSWLTWLGERAAQPREPWSPVEPSRGSEGGGHDAHLRRRAGGRAVTPSESCAGSWSGLRSRLRSLP
eukprot:3840791-Heterocapsa_arctica.AAC.1